MLAIGNVHHVAGLRGYSPRDTVSSLRLKFFDDSH